jgi:hypothetical protein
MFWPGVPEAAVDDAGAIDSAYRSAFNIDLTALLTALASEDVPMLLLHSDATTPNDVTSLTLLSPVSTQRRRIRR